MTQLIEVQKPSKHCHLWRQKYTSQQIQQSKSNNKFSIRISFTFVAIKPNDQTIPKAAADNNKAYCKHMKNDLFWAVHDLSVLYLVKVIKFANVTKATQVRL